MANDKEFKYEFDEAFFKQHKQTQYVLKNVQPESRVCEFGCHSGLLSKFLIEQGCQVTGFDVDENAINKAKERHVNAYYADLNCTSVWENIIEGKTFDSVLFLHILEHLYSPLEVLKKSTKYLNKNGTIIIALPNICNAKNRFEIGLRGIFEYKDLGVMDSTHIRFFSYDSALKMISQASLKVIDYYSPQRVNPPREFIDNLPFFNKFKKILREEKPLFLPFSRNITDVVMIFKCVIVD